MKKPSQEQHRTPAPAVGRLVRRLLSAVDRSIEAAEQARRARDDLTRLAAEREAKR
jgi:hypothetical protein